MPVPVEARLDQLLARPNLELEICPLMGEYWYRPGQVLVHRDDLPMVAEELRRWEAREVALPTPLTHLRSVDFPVKIFRLPARMSVEAVVTRLRQVPSGAEPRVGPNHVYGAMQGFVPFPADNPAPVAPLAPPPLPPAANFTVAVIDTGMVTGGPAAGFANMSAGHVTFDPAADVEKLDSLPADGLLDPTDAHGIFVGGIVLRTAPAASLLMRKTLLGGLNDELELANAIYGAATAKVINLSLGGYCKDDVAPWPLDVALHALDRSVAVVAAAGNYGRRRPCWPAAFKRVIAVAAVDVVPGAAGVFPAKAAFSNYGWWVDACSHGVGVVSNFVKFAESNGTVFSEWATWSGTSFAAPKVAGRIAAAAMASGTTAQQAATKLLDGSGLPWRPGLGTLVG